MGRLSQSGQRGLLNTPRRHVLEPAFVALRRRPRVVAIAHRAWSHEKMLSLGWLKDLPWRSMYRLPPWPRYTFWSYLVGNDWM
jgi:hypothetical protein